VIKYDKSIKRYTMKKKEYLLSIQHLFAMFGATILVPLLTGFNPATCLITAGLGTLIFHFVTGGIVPVFLGSSFAFIPAILSVNNPQLSQGGIIFAGLVHILLAGLVYLVGVQNIKKLFPPVITGSVIILIGLGLAPVGLHDAMTQPIISLITLGIIILLTTFGKGLFRLIPLLIGLLIGYIISLSCGLVDFTPILKANWVNIPFVTKGFFSLPQFSWSTIIAISPIALVTFLEHLGDITTNGSVVGKDFISKPGLHRTLLGDGLATCLAGFLGGTTVTTYAENTAVLATTKNYNPALLRMTAIFAIFLGFFGKFGAFLQTIPTCVKGGIEILLFGMIASIGVKTLAENNIDFKDNRNLIICGLILVFGLGIKDFAVFGVHISGLFVAVIVGMIANLVLKREKKLESNIVN
jgi:uracil permease